MSLLENDRFYEARQEWLENGGYSEGDVMEDEQGEFVIDFVDNGSPGEDGYDVKKVRVYLPKEFSINYSRA